MLFWCSWERLRVSQLVKNAEIAIVSTAFENIAIDSSYLPWCAEISLKGYTKDTLYLSFSDGSFWQGALVGNIDKTIRNDWYSDTLLVTYHTSKEYKSDSVVVKYYFGK